jgi:integrase
MRPFGRLNAIQVNRALKRPISLCDGGGLYFVSRPPNGASWMFRYGHNGKDRWMGLGPYPTITLADARARAADERRRLQDDIDPIQHRHMRRDQARLEAAKAVTFAQCAEQFIASHQTGWKNPKHRAQWASTIKTYCFSIATLPVGTIDTALVVKVLQPIWNTKPETASRLRGRIESVLDWATVRGFRQGENPARWRGHLDKLLPAKNKVRRVEHHAALPYADMPTFMAKLDGQEGTSARALKLLILTATRTSEMIGARWAEIDLAKKQWTIPADRMKAYREHRIPLSAHAVKILEAIKPAKVENDTFVFSGNKPGRPLSNMAFLMLLRRMGHDKMTAHGFRSTFRDWCAERTHYPAEVAEMALAHTVSSKVEAAYRRGDLLEKRRRLMDEWATYCTSPEAAGHNIVPLREAVS